VILGKPKKSKALENGVLLGLFVNDIHKYPPRQKAI
jgi:hypothetical protein